jgi:hypothetical protein
MKEYGDEVVYSDMPFHTISMKIGQFVYCLLIWPDTLAEIQEHHFPRTCRSSESLPQIRQVVRRLGHMLLMLC